MNEDLLKVQLSPSDGQMYGTFTEGMPVAEMLEHVFAFHIDGKDGSRVRRYGRVIGVSDVLLKIDNTENSNEQVLSTTIHFTGGDPLVINWPDTALAVAEVAHEGEQ